MEKVQLLELLEYAVKRLRKEYGSIRDFAVMYEDGNLLSYQKGGRYIPAERVQTYLSLPKDGSPNTNFKFLKVLFWELWSIEIDQVHKVEKWTEYTVKGKLST